MKPFPILAAIIVGVCAFELGGCMQPPPILKGQLRMSQRCTNTTCASSVQTALLANGEGNPPMRIDCAYNTLANGNTRFQFTIATNENTQLTDGVLICGEVTPTMTTSAAVDLYFGGTVVSRQITPTCTVDIQSLAGANYSGRFKCDNVVDASQRTHLVSGLVGVTATPDFAEFSFENCKKFPLNPCN